MSESARGRDERPSSVLNSMASSFKMLQIGVSKFAQELFGSPSSLYKPAVEELFRECEFVGEWISECNSQFSAEQLTKNTVERVFMEKLATISRFLSECVLTVVLGDLSALLESYQSEILQGLTQPILN